MIENIQSARPLPDARPVLPSPDPPVIQLEDIQSIVYLGVKGPLPAVESHRVDTFA
jgi:hypothetical protein